MRWLIVEDALKDRKGHWFEYVRTFRQGLLELGDSVSVLASKEAEPFIQTELEARAVLPESIWHQLGGRGGALKRFWQVPRLAFKTWRSMRAILKADDVYDVIFVPTVSVHHLLGWVRLIKGSLRNRRTRVLLYFVSTPIKLGSAGIPEWSKSPNTWLLARLLANLRAEAASGKVVIGVETVPLQAALSQVTGLPVHYLPQPVEPLPDALTTPQRKLVFACYGAARHEKGSDILQKAIAQFLQTHPLSSARFAIQWIDDFHDEAGLQVTKSPALLKDSRVEYITRYFRDGEYFQRLSQTAVMLLPYRLSSYGLRGSRVLIEALLNGIPVVATSGTTLAEQAEQFGAAVLCEDGNVESLIQAIETVESSFPQLEALAEERKIAAQAHFSVKYFRDLLTMNFLS